jgi:hypothetical protein
MLEAAQEEGSEIVHMFSLSLSVERLLIVFVSTNPHPYKPVFVFDCEGSVISANTG